MASSGTGDFLCHCWWDCGAWAHERCGRRWANSVLRSLLPSIRWQGSLGVSCVRLPVLRESEGPEDTPLLLCRVPRWHQSEDWERPRWHQCIPGCWGAAGLAGERCGLTRLHAILNGVLKECVLSSERGGIKLCLEVLLCLEQRCPNIFRLYTPISIKFLSACPYRWYTSTTVLIYYVHFKTTQK